MGLKSPIPIDQLTLNEPVPYKIEVDRELLAVTKKKLELARYPEEQNDFGEDDWSQGAKVSRVKELAQFWKDEYDWEKQVVSPFNLMRNILLYLIQCTHYY